MRAQDRKPVSRCAALALPAGRALLGSHDGCGRKLILTSPLHLFHRVLCCPSPSHHTVACFSPLLAAAAAFPCLLLPVLLRSCVSLSNATSALWLDTLPCPHVTHTHGHLSVSVQSWARRAEKGLSAQLGPSGGRSGGGAASKAGA